MRATSILIIIIFLLLLFLLLYIEDWWFSPKFAGGREGLIRSGATPGKDAFLEVADTRS